MIAAIGQDSHRFETHPTGKPLILAGITFDSHLGLSANSDGDVVFHAVTNAVSGITGVNILGKVSDKMCLEEGITDSRVYLDEALKYLGVRRLTHLSVSIECLHPKIAPQVDAMKESLSAALGLPASSIGITATTGEGLTAFGRGEGISVFCILSAETQRG